MIVTPVCKADTGVSYLRFMNSYYEMPVFFYKKTGMTESI